jgi:DNA repair exonuclease SbcCD ATPase subunit
MSNQNSNSVDLTKQINQLVNFKKSIYREIYSNEEEIKRLKKKINEIEKLLMGLCNHSWEYENYAGMYDKPDKICKFCDSRIVRF